MIHKIPTDLIDGYSKGPSPSTVAAAVTVHEKIRDLLGEDYETFLQGSYRNETAISDLNDVDIVVVRKHTYSGVFAPLRRIQSQKHLGYGGLE